MVSIRSYGRKALNRIFVVIAEAIIITGFLKVWEELKLEWIWSMVIGIGILLFIYEEWAARREVGKSG